MLALINFIINKQPTTTAATSTSTKAMSLAVGVVNTFGHPPHPHLYLPGGGDPSMSDVAAVVELANINREGSWVPGGKLT